MDENLLDFSHEPSEETAVQIVKFCQIYAPQSFEGKVLFERPPDDPWLQGRNSQVYDIETASSFSQESRIQLEGVYFPHYTIDYFIVFST